MGEEEEITLSETTIERLKRLQKQNEIYVFSAKWCTNCPYAKAVAKAFVQTVPDKLTLKIVDVEEEPLGIWEEKIKQGKLVVIPATGILIKGEPSVIIGTENLEQRLIQLLEESEEK